MTRKDYEKIAAILFPFAHNSKDFPDKTESDRGITYAGKEIANRMADMLAADNPRFDRARFLRACGLED